ncbi:hypothetical protein [Denitromonas sp.]|uniref:hypothetical protein n=1 Tax=Denitromonas sp. TaxID=2734609 RepID=UPI002AFE4DA3|nr:hypothetical protein [Denitromonas sp.]
MKKYLERLRQIVRHPLTKRIGLAVPINACMGLARSWLGYEQSAFIGLLTGVASVALADLILSDSNTRKARWEQTLNLVRENWGSAARMGALLAVMGLTYSNRQSPAEPLVQQVLAMVEILGLVAVMVVPPLRDVLMTASSGGWNTVSSMVSRFVWGLTAYTVALWMIGAAGDDAYRWVAANPNEATVMAASLAICWAILRVGSGPAATPAIARSGMAAAAGVAVFPRRPTPRDNRYTAAHEAGHALVYAALGSLPADVKLAVNEQPDENGTLGFVTGISSKHHLDEKSFAEWYMLVFLAGKLGEAVMHGESTLGSSNDHLRWLSVARSYLANHYRGMYYAEPQNKFEQEQNEAKLEALQAEQLAMLRTLFDANADVFKQLADTLLETRTMGRDDLIPFLSRVKLPDSFPLPFGPFAQFSAQWPEDTECNTR